MAATYIAGLLVEQRLSEMRAEAARESLGHRVAREGRRGWRDRVRHLVPFRPNGLRAAAPSRPGTA